MGRLAETCLDLILELVLAQFLKVLSMKKFCQAAIEGRALICNNLSATHLAVMPKVGFTATGS